MSTLALNAGSTSLKFGLFDEHASQPLVAGEIDWANGDRKRARLIRLPRQGSIERSYVAVPDAAAAATCAIRAVIGSKLPKTGRPPVITAVGHRVVHGGTQFCASVRIDSQVKAAIARLSELAPLHNPPAMKAIEAAEAALPGVAQVAVFDTAFYAPLPPKAYVYPLPYDWHKTWGIRRFGFHGISHEYCAGRAAELLRRDSAQLHLITCHLGGGCSATAIRGGSPVATTMGFSPLEGLMMATRSGSIDPGILFHLQRQRGLSLEELEHALNYSSGLLGVSGISSNLVQIELAAAKGNQRARLAFDMFADRVRCAIGALATTLGGLDALVFTGRAGEGSACLRAAVCEGLGFIGLRLDHKRNVNTRPDTDIAAANSPARVLVIHTREELMVAREARRVIELQPPKKKAARL